EPGDAYDAVRAPRCALDGLGLEAHLAQRRDDVLSSFALTRTGPVTRVRGVDPQQVAAQPGDLVLARLRHARPPAPASGRTREHQCPVPLVAVRGTVVRSKECPEGDLNSHAR